MPVLAPIESNCMNPSRLRCPNCLGEFLNNANLLKCSLCVKEWPIVGGVPVLTESSTLYPKEHLTSQQFEEFLESIDSEGWEPAIEIAIGNMEKPETFKALAFDEARRDLSHFLPVLGDSVVLDYGSGMGGISFGLARSCKWVYSIDQSLFRSRFIRERSKNTGVGNITAVCTGNTRYLPFPDESFNVVVLSGVLEWMPLACDGNPTRIQVGALREMSRVLKKGGVLYIGIENRFGYRYVMLGKGDSHNQEKRKLSYITVIPRFLADIYSRIAIGHPYRCYLYSYFGYKKMLFEANFSNCKFYFPYPNHNRLSYIIPLEDYESSALSLEHILGNVTIPRRERWVLRLLQKAHLLKFLAQEYSIIATK